jgi:diguanylate cyclase (GGDEF)-like protein
VIVVEIGGADADDVVAFAAEIADRPAPVRAIALARRDDSVDRLALARAGVGVVLADTPSVDEVLDAVDALVTGDRGRQPLVLLVDDDPVVLGLARGFLEAADLRVETLTEPARFSEILTRTRPDAVVLDVDMPGVDGADLCRVVRADPVWRALPVLFLTAHTDPATVQRVFAAGADDFVAKPIVGPELTARISNRLERARLLANLANTDPVSELPNRRAILRDLARMLADTSRTGQPFAIAILDLEGVAAANEARGYDAGDALLRSSAVRLAQGVRGAGVVGRWVSDRFVVGLPGLTAAQAAQRLLELEPGQPDDEAAASFAAGVAAFPVDGRDVAELARSADRACSLAQTRGHAQVICCGDAAAIDDGAPDVLIVDDDEALAGLLLDTLKGRGYHVRWLGDGPSAAAALLGAPPTLRPRSIVLDVNLPGLSGLDLLRALHAAGVTRRSRVVMLTGRAAEAEVVEALELGAFDHVAKPFSVPVLVQRLRRALEA